MKVTHTIALRTIRTRRRRSFLTVAALAFSCVVVTFFVSLQLSSYDTAQQMATGLWSGEAQVMHPDFRDKQSPRAAFRVNADSLKQLKSDPRLKGITVRGEATALLSSDERTYGAKIVGVDPDSEPLVTRLHTLITKGEFVDNDSPLGVILGTTLADNLQVSLGDECTILGQGLDGSVAAAVFRVHGLISTGVKEFDRGLVMIPLSTFDEVFYAYGRVHSIVAALATDAGAPAAEILVASKLTNSAEAQTYSWQELLPDLVESQKLDFISSWFFYLGLLAVVAITLTNTITMTVMERRYEFGLMRAVGTKKRQLVSIVAYEAFYLFLAGITLGLAIAAALILYFGEYGFPIPGAEEFTAEFNLPSRIYTRFSWIGMTAVPLLLGLFSIAALIPSVILVLRIQPLKALRLKQ